MKSDEILIKTFDQVKNDNFDQVKFDQVIVCLSDNISWCLSPTLISATVHNIEYIGRELGKDNRFDKKSRNLIFCGA